MARRLDVGAVTRPLAAPEAPPAKPPPDHGFAVATRVAAHGRTSSPEHSAGADGGMVHALNAWLDRLPEAAWRDSAAATPAFRQCGVAASYVAALVTLGGGLAAGLPAVLLTGICAVAGVSFVAWALLRRALTATERLVQLEHVWIAVGCVAAFAAVAGADVLAALDAAAPGLAVFLAAGRVGCTLVGCCHGRPSSIGIAYGATAVRGGFPRELVGVRLAPVAVIESAALLAIAAAALGLALLAPAGAAIVWFLLAHAIVRFGLESLRGDPRPGWLGLTRNRWMCLVQCAFALWLDSGA